MLFPFWKDDRNWTHGPIDRHLQTFHVREWYASEVEKKLANGCQTKAIKVSLEISSLWDKKSRCIWLLNVFTYINNDLSIFLSGWLKCGITNAPENVVPSVIHFCTPNICYTCVKS